MTTGFRFLAPFVTLLTLSLMAPPAFAQDGGIDDDPLMPEKEFDDARATIETEEEPPLGPDPGEPKLADRCYAHELVVPEHENEEKAYELFQKQIEKWISTCVASRTLGKDGKPLRRERKLVRNNATLRDLHALLPPGQKVRVDADYQFDGRRVRAINFY